METLVKQEKGMACPRCGNAVKRFGHHRNGLQRFRCLVCKKTFTESHERSFRVEDYLNEDRGQLAVRLLVEGCSIRTAERMTGIRRDSIVQLLLIAGDRSEKMMNRLIRNVPVRDVQADEIWGFIGKKERNKRPEEFENNDIGDSWCWVAIERYSKLVLAFTVGQRTSEDAAIFTERLRYATSPNSRFQLTTDGWRAYLYAVDLNLYDRCDFAQLIKFYSQPQTTEQRYSPAEIVEAVPVVVMGNPDPEKICTSHVERQNLTMRMQIRRLTRLTNAFSKKIESHRAAIALHFAWYNFCQIHSRLRVTPAMEAGITDHVWKVNELLATCS